MIKVFVNNKAVLVPKNTSALEACESIGVAVPRFCYHERLNVAGNCRMCLVEIEKAPKPIASCAFPVAPNMRIFTDTPLVQKARENVLEFLLLNHPLDCPICDQGGECDLQEQTAVFGSDRSRYFYAKRGVEDKNCGPLVKTIMTRCIHCTRCVRFFQDIAGQEDFGTTLRGKETEIGTYIGKRLTSELSGNIIDLCPVGALTSKPYAFTARPWELKSVETIDTSDSVGSNIKLSFKETEILRVLPALNDTLNEEWISDKTRFSFDGLKINRVGQPYASQNGSLKKISWKQALEVFSDAFYKNNKKVIICGNNLDLETLELLKVTSENCGIPIVTENYLNDDSNSMLFSRSNATFEDILESDLCLTIGTNVRFEAALLNVRLNKRRRRGNFVKASIGLAENLNYKNEYLGNSLKTLLDIVEGKHPFCKKLYKAEKPVIILGTSLKKRVDSKTIENLITSLSKNCKIVDENWLGINFLPVTPNSVGEAFLGVSQNAKVDLSNVNFAYCVGVDFPEKFINKFNKNTFIAVQTPYASVSLKNVNLILPSNAFTEKEGTFLNLEGRLQKTTTALLGPNLARDDRSIIKAIWSSLEQISANSFKYRNNAENKKLVGDFNENKNSFTKFLLSNKNLGKKKILKTPLKNIMSDFFMTNAVSKNSLTMAKCSEIFKKNYTNFI
jgi:NADH dehydrogenase (ubiquinone) Fe-S protein 1